MFLGKLRVIPYLRVREGCFILKESIPNINIAPSSTKKEIDPPLSDLNTFFSPKELNRLSNLLYKLALFKRKIDGHELTDEFFASNKDLLICLRRLNLLNFQNLPEIPSYKNNSNNTTIDNVDSIKSLARNDDAIHSPPALPKLSCESDLALMHPSILKSLKPSKYSKEKVTQLSRENQRLEFYGDSILGELAARSVMERFPNASDGLLTSIRSLIVQNDTLIVYAHIVGLPDLLKKYTNDKFYKSKILADCFESYIAKAKFEGGETYQKMILCLEQLLEPIYLRIEANLHCRFGTTELKVDEILCDWFNVNEDVRLAIERQRLQNVDEYGLPRFEKAPAKYEVEQMKDFIKFSPTLSKKNRSSSKSKPVLQLIKSNPLEGLRVIQSNKNLKSVDNVNDAVEVFDLMSSQMKAMELRNRFKLNNSTKKANDILMRAKLRSTPRSKASSLPVFHITTSKKNKKVVCRVLIKGAVVSEGRGSTLLKSKKKLVKKLLTCYTPQLAKHYEVFFEK